MANQFLGLSLFIMLLSFFIILNAISSFEVTKSQPVLNSLTVAFSNKRATEDVAPGASKIKTPNKQLGSTLDQVQGLFESQIATAKAKQNRLGTNMVVRMPFDDFQKAMRSSLTVRDDSPSLMRSEQVDLLPMLVSLLETQRDVTYKMDMLLMVDDEPTTIISEAPDQFSALNRSVSAIARTLEEAGLPRKQVSAGLKQGSDGIIELVFSRYLPFNPLGVDQVGSATQQEAP